MQETDRQTGRWPEGGGGGGIRGSKDRDVVFATRSQTIPAGGRQTTPAEPPGMINYPQGSFPLLTAAVLVLSGYVSRCV